MAQPSQTQASDVDETAAYYRALLKPVFRDRRFIVIGGPVRGLTALATSLKKLGAERLFLLGSSMGTGADVDPELADWHSLEHRSTSVVEEFRRYEAALCELPADARAALDAFDPERRARVIGAIVLNDVPGVGGRERFGRRLPAWVALEDKVAIEDFWRTLGVETAPSRIAPAQRSALDAAHRALDRGAGCVWAGDASEGVNGGAEYTRWIRSSNDAAEASAFFSAHCQRVRVMPFLEGVPCSIHGMVFPDFVAAFRPVELVTLRRPDSNTFVYAGVATFWDPPAADREHMRSLARRVGDGLRTAVGFRGAFTIDGVLSDGGFLPTELNPRFGAGLGPIGAAVPSLPLAPLALALAEGEDLDWQPQRLEAALVAAADRQRGGRASLPLTKQSAETHFHPVVLEAGDYRMAEGDEPDSGAFMLGPGPIGSFFSFGAAPDSIPAGSFFAPYGVKALALADAVLGTGIGTLEAARPAQR